MIGLYPLSNVTTPEASSVIASFIASEIVGTTLPNSLLVTPSATTPAYSFNTSVQASTGGIVQTGLANSTYSAIFGSVTAVPVPSSLNLSAIPLITPAPTVTTLTITGSDGTLSTTVSHFTVPSIVLGVPPGWSSAGFTVHIPVLTSLLIVTALPSLLSFLLHYASLDSI